MLLSCTVTENVFICGTRENACYLKQTADQKMAAHMCSRNELETVQCTPALAVIKIGKINFATVDNTNF
jgi:hypothetical protein